jgi:DedD protein
LTDSQEERVVTDVRKIEERGRTFRAGVLLYLACIAVCGIFFALGFLVGFNERGSHSAPSTEVVTGPSVIPPTINAPPDSGQQIPSPDTSGDRTAPNAEPETEIIPSTPNQPSQAAAENPSSAASSKKKHKAEEAPAPPPAQSAAHGDVGEGIILQVAALRTKDDAETMVNLLRGRGYAVFMSTPQKSHAEDSLYRVEVGPYRTRAEADKARDKLVQDGFKPFIKH